MGRHKNNLNIQQKMEVLDFVRGNRDALTGRTLTEIYESVMEGTGHGCGRAALYAICRHASVDVRRRARRPTRLDAVEACLSKALVELAGLGAATGLHDFAAKMDALLASLKEGGSDGKN